MSTRTSLSTFVVVISLFALACGDDSDESGSSSTGGCFFSDQTCQASSGIGAACGVLGGTAKDCPADNVDATCVYTEDGHATTIYYYKTTSGAAWSDGFGTASDDCSSYSGTFMDK